MSRDGQELRNLRKRQSPLGSIQLQVAVAARSSKVVRIELIELWAAFGSLEAALMALRKAFDLAMHFMKQNYYDEQSILATGQRDG